MTTPRATTVVCGDIVTRALPDRLETAEAIGITDGRVVSAGSRSDVTDAAEPRARIIDVGRSAVIPGLHDFHLHLVGLARARRQVRLEDAASSMELLERVRAAAPQLPAGVWLLGRGWTEALLPESILERLEAAVGERPAWLGSRDGHSAWASAAARALAGIARATPDPPGGRFERDAAGEPNGLLREAATASVNAIAERLTGVPLLGALHEAVTELAGYGITAATDAGDFDTSNGVGAWAEFGDSFSNLLSSDLRRRLRLSVDIPADAIGSAALRGLHSGDELGPLLRFGWAKLYSDGALGSRTAALFDPYTCDGTAGIGILRITAGGLDELLADARRARIGMAIHAIGDRAIATVLDGFARAPRRLAGALPDRLEHAQLVRPLDLPQFAALDVTASMQPLHCPSDRDAVEACWRGRQDQAYAWRSLVASGARLAFGSDAPVEPADPWLGMFAAVHRRYPGDARDWHPEQAIGLPQALRAYTLGPALSALRVDEGHLLPGALADLAVLDTDLATLLAADERLARVRSQLTMVAGEETHRS